MIVGRPTNEEIGFLVNDGMTWIGPWHSYLLF